MRKFTLHCSKCGDTFVTTLSHLPKITIRSFAGGEKTYINASTLMCSKCLNPVEVYVEKNS